MRLFLAISCFFRVLLGRPLPRSLLPAPERPPALREPAPAARAPRAEERLLPGAIALLTLFQREGRLVDFLEQDVTTFPDAEVGAAARVVHEGCRKALRAHALVKPVRAADLERVLAELK